MHTDLIYQISKNRPNLANFNKGLIFPLYKKIPNPSQPPTGQKNNPDPDFF